MNVSTIPQGMKSFSVIWLGQTVSTIGNGLTGFALGVWLYRSTGSVTLFSLIQLFVLLPGLLISPLAGALVDRWDRRWTMILADAGSGLTTVLIASLIYFDRLQIWHLYVLIGLSSICSAFQYPAFSAATTLLVGKQNLSRAAGMNQLTQAAGMILGPLLAPILEGYIGLSGVMMTDVLTFLVAVGTLLAIRVPRPERSAVAQAAAGSLFKEIAFGWHYLKERPGFMALLVTFATVNIGFGYLAVLATPIILGMADATVLGRVLAFSSFGMVAGSLLMSLWGGPKRRVRAILVVCCLLGGLLFLAGLQQNPVSMGILAFLFTGISPILTASSQAIWQSKVEPDLQGRVFAARRMVAYSALPLSYGTAGPLSDYLFKPLLAPGGPLVGVLGPIFGVGEVRGLGLFLSLLGLMIATVGAIASRYAPLRNLETDLPDVIDSVESV